MQRVHLEYLGDSVELPLGETLVGRDLVCAFRFNDPTVSRRHLRFIRRHDEVFVEDLGSSNGTQLNGRLVAAPLRILDGDQISVGNRVVTIRIAQSEDFEEPKTLILENAEAQARSPRGATSQLPVTQPPPMGAQLRTDVHPDPNPIDRRRHDRQPVELHLVYVSSELEIEATSRDLSESGVFVCSQVLDPIGTECQLTILVDGGPPLGVHGIVRRVVDRESAGEPIGLGVEFVNAGLGELAWIRTLMSRMAPDDARSAAAAPA